MEGVMGADDPPRPKKEVVVDVAVDSSDGDPSEFVVVEVKTTFLAMAQFSSAERRQRD